MVRGGLETCYHGGRRKEGTNVLLMCRHNLPLNLFKRISFNTLCGDFIKLFTCIILKNYMTNTISYVIKSKSG